MIKVFRRCTIKLLVKQGTWSSSALKTFYIVQHPIRIVSAISEVLTCLSSAISTFRIDHLVKVKYENEDIKSSLLHYS